MSGKLNNNPDVFNTLFMDVNRKREQKAKGIPSITSDDNYQLNYKKLKTNLAIKIDSNGDIETSDALITDCGSFLAEYLPSKKPIMLLVNKNSIGYNEIGEKIVDSYYKAYKNDDIIDFIENVVIKENDHLEKERLLNLNLIQPNGDGAGKFIVNHIKDELMLNQ